jgi:hypothetical protein
MGWVRNVVLMNVYSGSGIPRGVGFLGKGGPDGLDGGKLGVSLRATQGRGGRIPSQQGGFQVSGKGNKGEQGEQGDHCVHNLSMLCTVYIRTNAVMNDTSCTYT